MVNIFVTKVAVHFDGNNTGRNVAKCQNKILPVKYQNVKCDKVLLVINCMLIIIQPLHDLSSEYYTPNIFNMSSVSSNIEDVCDRSRYYPASSRPCAQIAQRLPVIIPTLSVASKK